MPRLTELQARFLRYEERDGATFYRHVDSIEDAQGVSFLCPKCFSENGGPKGTHAVICWSRSRGVPDDARPKPGRWSMSGSSVEDLTLNGDPPGSARSVQLHGGCCWHGHVTNGVAE